MVMNPTRKCHLQYSGRPLRGACTDSCPWARVSQRLASPKKDDLKNLKTFAQLTMEVQNLLYLSASPPLEHSGADQELLKTKSGATGLALSSFGFGKKRPQRNATLKGKSQLQTQNNTFEGTDKHVAMILIFSSSICFWRITFNQLKLIQDSTNYED